MKILGVAILLFSGAAFCFVMVSELERRLKNIRALCELLRITKRMVDSFSMSARDILNKLPRELMNNCGYSDATAPQGFYDFAVACEVCDREAKEILLEFAATFGKSYRAEQLRQCEYYVERMSERELELSQKLPVQKKLVLTLVLSVTLMIVILLI